MLVQATPPLRLLPEMSAGSAGAAAVLADWGRPASTVDSSIVQAGAQAQAPGVPPIFAPGLSVILPYP